MSLHFWHRAPGNTVPLVICARYSFCALYKIKSFEGPEPTAAAEPRHGLVL